MCFAPVAMKDVRGVLKALEVVLYTVEAVNGVICALSVLRFFLCVLFYTLLCVLEVVGVSSVGGTRGVGGGVLWASLFARGCRGRPHFRSFEISIVVVYSLRSSLGS